MFHLLVGLILLSSVGAQANCSVAFERPSGAAMSANYITEKTYLQIVDLLTDKGYEVFAPEEILDPAYSLKVKGYYGYGCGTGLKFYDYLTVPAYNEIEFEGPDNMMISQEKSFSSPIGVRKIARRHLLNVIKNLPECY